VAQLLKNQNIMIASDVISRNKKFPASIQRIEKDFIALELSSIPVAIPAGTPLTIYFWDENSIFTFDTVCLTAKSNILTYFNIQKPRNIKKTFKRNYQRVDLKIRAVITEIDNSRKEKCLISDLSAGGAKMIARSGKKNGSLFKLHFDLPDGQFLDDVDVTVMRDIPLPKGLCEYGLEFSGMSKIRQQKINDYIVNAILNNEVKVID
jgi:c-di-GMP-binding flagellar brake protein YcgR